MSDLLRKALFVATKLKHDDFRDWISNELKGYAESAPIPKYRHVHCIIKLVNPGRGLIDFVLPSKVEDQLSTLYIKQSIESILDEVDKCDNGFLTYSFPSEITEYLRKNQIDTDFQAVRVFSSSNLVSIVDTVKTAILEWSLKLEDEGILGTNLTFTQEEKTMSKNINIENFQGILGNVESSNVTQDLKMQIKKGDFDSLSDFLKSKNVSDADIIQLSEAINVDDKPSQKGSFGSQVSKWIGKMTSKAADGSWAIGLGASGNLLADAISRYYGF